MLVSGSSITPLRSSTSAPGSQRSSSRSGHSDSDHASRRSAPGSATSAQTSVGCSWASSAAGITGWDRSMSSTWVGRDDRIASTRRSSTMSGSSNVVHPAAATSPAISARFTMCL